MQIIQIQLRFNVSALYYTSGEYDKDASRIGVSVRFASSLHLMHDAPSLMECKLTLMNWICC